MHPVGTRVGVAGGSDYSQRERRPDLRGIDAFVGQLAQVLSGFIDLVEADLDLERGPATIGKLDDRVCFQLGVVPVVENGGFDRLMYLALMGNRKLISTLVSGNITPKASSSP